MKSRHKRIAFAVIAILLAGAGLWRWSHVAVAHAVLPADSAATSSGEVQVVMPHTLNPSSAGMPASEAPDHCSMAIRDAFNVRARKLALRQDANSQLAYALATPFDESFDFAHMNPVAINRAVEKRSAKTQNALLRAGELAPDKPEVLFLVANQCVGGDSCRGVQQTLLAADPDNAAAWLLEMSWARMRNDPAASERAFALAAKATRYDRYPDSALQVLMDAYGEVPLPAECSSEAARAITRRATGMNRDFSVLDQALMLAGASRVIPAINDIRLRCKPQAGVRMGVATRVGCRNIMTKMADGDNFLESAIALDTMVRLTAEDPDGSAWRERYRQFRWMYAQVGNSEVQRQLQPEDYAMDEVQTIQAALEASGLWPPPADWLPDDETARSLIQTGHPPPPKTH